MISVAVVCLKPAVFSTLDGYHNSGKLKNVLKMCLSIFRGDKG